jgi:isopentenyl-diphosphate delta-isomerase
MSESVQDFEKRKVAHIQHALSETAQTPHLKDISSIRLIHEALPDFDFEDVNIENHTFNLPLKSPLFISSMTAGHTEGVQLNHRLAKAAQEHGWLMGVGSQRRELRDPSAAREWKSLRKVAPHAVLAGNLGIAQIVSTSIDQIKKLIEGLEASALFVHLNPLQEVLQLEGTPQFKGGLQAIEKLCRDLPVPVVVKEVGCGISASTAKRLESAGVFAIDVAGLGGTHWGRIEGLRARDVNPESLQSLASETFRDWGLGVVESLLQVKEMADSCQVWASGGVRTGLDAAKLIALGASLVGIAQPLLKAAIQSDEALDLKMRQFELELKIAMFCSGAVRLQHLNRSKVVGWVK